MCLSSPCRPWNLTFPNNFVYRPSCVFPPEVFTCDHPSNKLGTHTSHPPADITLTSTTRCSYKGFYKPSFPSRVQLTPSTVNPATNYPMRHPMAMKLGVVRARAFYDGDPIMMFLSPAPVLRIAHPRSHMLALLLVADSYGWAGCAADLFERINTGEKLEVQQVRNVLEYMAHHNQLNSFCRIRRKTPKCGINT